jgi:hypothetical protein
MLKRQCLVVCVVLLSCVVGSAKDKKKALLPADILQAHTVLVLIDPDAGVNVEDPNANRIAQQDVEKALMRWGWLSPVMEASTADLIITVHKGSGRAVQPVIQGVPQNNRPVVLEPTDSGGRVGVQRGNPGNAGDASDPQYSPSGPQPGVQVGGSEDTFAVYRGNKDTPNSPPLEAAPVWRYTAKDALESPGVNAVDVFRQLVEASEKQQAGKP